MRAEKGKVRAPEIGRERYRDNRVAAFAFTFTSCVDPVASALQAATVPES